jgi:hypothetical protein
MLARPVVRPREAGFDEALVDGVERVVDCDDRASMVTSSAEVGITDWMRILIGLS